MRETIGLQTIFQGVIIFTLIFAAFIAVAITYNKAFKIKNEMLSIVEKYEGVNDTSIQIINNYLQNNGYSTTNGCDSSEVGIKDLNATKKEVAKKNEEYYYCMKSTVKNSQIFYDVRVFFKFNLPFFGDLLTFSVTGQTKGIKYYSPSQKL